MRYDLRVRFLDLNLAAQRPAPFANLLGRKTQVTEHKTMGERAVNGAQY